MGSVLGIALTPLVLFLFPKLAEKLSSSDNLGVIGGASSPLSLIGVHAISENDKAFTEKYLSDDVLTSASSTPYISSQEQSRPQSKKRNIPLYKAFDVDMTSKGSSNNNNNNNNHNNDDDDILTGIGFTASAYGVASVASSALGALNNAINGKGRKWFVIASLVLGGIVVYKVVRK